MLRDPLEDLPEAELSPRNRLNDELIPLIRVPEGIEIRLTLRNPLPSIAVVHGLHQHPGAVNDVVELPPGDKRELRFTAGSAGTYQYWASTVQDLKRSRHGWPYREDSQLAGALVVDTPGATASDRIFVLGVWRNDVSKPLSQYVPVIIGKSWPYTERLAYNLGDQVRWRLINARDSPHPMHMHGTRLAKGCRQHAQKGPGANRTSTWILLS
jgi:FtsP/CotA-like multicopper oxidase with cupredoxin domain